MAWLGRKERQNSAELQLARPWVNLEYLSENTNFYGTPYREKTRTKIPRLLMFAIFFKKKESTLEVGIFTQIF